MLPTAPAPIATSTIRLPATLYELRDSFERMHIISDDTKYTMEVVDGGLGYLSQFITESDRDCLPWMLGDLTVLRVW